MKTLTNKRILLGVSGSIAAYKAPDIVRRLQDLGAEVRVILTNGGAKFITELSLQTTSKHKVHSNLWDKEAELAMGHIELARWADAFLVAPASANTIANLASGKACDLLTSIALAFEGKILIAPAMNQAMYHSNGVQNNLAILKKHSIEMITDSGEQACGDVGEGRLAQPETIAQKVSDAFTNTKLTGKNILITLGATIEPIDPVRYLSNHSSGKMGNALAQACIESGANVTLIHGNVSTELTQQSHKLPVDTAEQMYQKVMEVIKDQDIFISVAAVSDYRIKNVEKNKIKRENKHLTLDLVANKDILYEVSQLENGPLCIGFAAETENIVKNAQNKLKNKGCDVIIANDVSKPDFGMKNDDNEVYFISQNFSEKIEKNNKQKIARKIVKIFIRKFL